MVKLRHISFHVQTRFEMIRGDAGERFLELCREGGNIFLEFGVQTVIPAEMEMIGRRNDVAHMAKVMRRLKEMRIPFDTNLIYGIPGQTMESFAQSIDFVIQNGCRSSDVRCFALRIPKGSAIRSRAGFVREFPLPSDNCETKVVCSSSSFSFGEWMGMKAMAESLQSAPGSWNPLASCARLRTLIRPSHAT
jgi:hypothetical protein